MENKKKHIRNIPHEKAISLADEVVVMPGQVVSKTLVQNSAVSLTVFAFDSGEEIGAHDSKGDALVTVLEGEALLTVGGVVHRVRAGQSLVMPAGIEHSVRAPGPFKMLLTVVFPL